MFRCYFNIFMCIPVKSQIYYAYAEYVVFNLI
jgi:hypothetical protein